MHPYSYIDPNFVILTGEPAPFQLRRGSRDVECQCDEHGWPKTKRDLFALIQDLWRGLGRYGIFQGRLAA